MNFSKFSAFAILSSFCIFLILIRLIKSGILSNISNHRIISRHQLTFVFLIWNLFLAWVPYLISHLYTRQQFVQKSIYLRLILLSCWLLFFPNALYIITDLLHLRPRSGIPYWYDIILLFSFSLTGIFLGFESLRNMIKLWRGTFSDKYYAITPYIFLFFGSIGVYIGRFLRWNSWDIISNPLHIVRDATAIFLFPDRHLHELAIIFCLTTFFSLIYWFINFIIND